MGEPVLLGLDPGSRRMGWCYGTGEGLPRCGAWVFPQAGQSLGAMLTYVHEPLCQLLTDQHIAEAAYEAPILTPHDRLGALRKTYSLGGHIEFVCTDYGIVCSEVDLRAVKRELAGMKTADKSDMVAAAEKLGVVLPASEAQGREDAADALGVWLLLLRARNRRLSSRFDAALWGGRANRLL